MVKGGIRSETGTENETGIENETRIENETEIEGYLEGKNIEPRRPQGKKETQ